MFVFELANNTVPSIGIISMLIINKTKNLT